MALEQPRRDVATPELLECGLQVVDRVEAAQPEKLLLEGADEAPGAAVALWLADKGGARGHAGEGELALEVIGDQLAAMIVAHGDAPGGTLVVGVEDLSDGPAE